MTTTGKGALYLSRDNVQANDFTATAGGSTLSTALQPNTTVALTDFTTTATNKVVRCLVGSVARTDTTAKTLGTLPASAIIVGVTLYSPTASDAGTTATLSIGKNGGTGTEYLNALNVKTGTGQITPTSTATLGTVGGTAVTVTGIYAETGTASTTGGPWQVFIDYTAG